MHQVCREAPHQRVQEGERSKTETCTLWRSTSRYQGFSVAIELQKLKTQNIKAKRSSLTQQQSATNLRQANNTNEVRNLNSIPQKENKGITYAQAVTN